MSHEASHAPAEHDDHGAKAGKHAEKSEHAKPVEKEKVIEKEKIIKEVTHDAPKKIAPVVKPIAPHTAAHSAHAPSFSHGADSSYFDDFTETIRTPLTKLFLAGAILATPYLVVGAKVGDTVLRKTVSKIPGVRHAYEVPRAAVINIATYTRDGIVNTLGLPALALQTVRDVGDGLMGKKTLEAKGRFGRLWESTVEKVFSVPGAGIEMGKKAASGTWGFIKDIFSSGKELGKASFDGYLSVLRKHPIAGLVATFGTIGAIADAGFIGAGAEVWGLGKNLVQALIHVLSSGAKWFGG